jgi:hypothetical protein
VNEDNAVSSRCIECGLNLLKIEMAPPVQQGPSHTLPDCAHSRLFHHSVIGINLLIVLCP